MSIKEAEFIGKQFQQKIVGPDSLSGEYYHIVKEEINSTQIHKKMEEEDAALSQEAGKIQDRKWQGAAHTDVTIQIPPYLPNL